MRASTEHQLQLLKLAEVDSATDRLQHLAKNMPEHEHLLSIENDRRSRRQAAAQAHGALDAAQAELARTRDDSRVVAERRARDEQLLAESTSTKEIAGLQAELATLTRRGDALAASELEQEETVAALQQQLDTARASLNEIEELAADLLQRREQARDHIREQARDLQLRRKAIIDSVPAELLQAYERARKNSGIGAAELVGTVSTASNLELGQSELAQIRSLAADELAYCPVTGAVLVRTARSDLQ